MGEEKLQEKPAEKVVIGPFKRRKQLERDLDHITSEMYRRNKELAETNKTLSLLGTIDALALESHTSVQMVSEHITEAITQATSFEFVGLFARSRTNSDVVTLNGWSGSSALG